MTAAGGVTPGRGLTKDDYNRRYLYYRLTLFPLNGKIPIPTNWTKFAELSQAELLQWLARYRQANVGILTGRRIKVVDLDGERGRRAWDNLQREYGEAPRTPRVRTPRDGLHLYFLKPVDLWLPNTVGLLGEGIDTRGDGGQVAAPPSIGANGRRYEWEIAPWDMPPGAPFAPLPEWLLVLLRPKPKPKPPASTTPSWLAVDPRAVAYAAAALNAAERSVRGAPDGERNKTLFREAASMFGFVAAGLLTEWEVRDRLGDAAVANGLPSGEVEKTLDSAHKRGMENPREVPPPTPTPRLVGVRR